MMNKIAHNHPVNIQNILNPFYKLIEFNDKLHEQFDEIIQIMNTNPEQIFQIIDDITNKTFFYEKGFMTKQTGYKFVNGRETFISFFNTHDPSVYKDIDIYNSNLIICTLFIILGVINHYMKQSKKCKYILLFKGGRVVNKYLQESPLDLKHPSFDIDVIIFQNIEKNLKVLIQY